MVEDPVYNFAVVLSHISQSNMDIEIDYNLIQKYVADNVLRDPSPIGDLSNKELKIFDRELSEKAKEHGYTLNLTINFDAIVEIENNIKDISPLTELLIVTKNQEEIDIDKLIDKGYENFGENRVQDAYAKFSKKIINDKNIKLHLIGPSNK